jgi:hypothetical protein
MSTPSIHLLAREIGILADAGYGGEYIGQPPAPRALQCSPQDLAVLLFRTAIALRRALLERSHNFFRKVSH